MDTDLEAAFSQCYRGRHAAPDAFFWLYRPNLPGPSGARPPQDVILDAEGRLRRAGASAVADTLLEALAALLDFDRRTGGEALRRARTTTGSTRAAPCR